MKLSKRLMAIASLIEKYSNHGRLADIGSDHGYLPCYLVEKEIISNAVACEIVDGPLEATKATIQLCHLEDVIKARKGDGLAPIVNESYEFVSICGMGGNLICDILKANLEKVDVEHLVLQPNINESFVRRYLYDNGWEIVDEDIVEDMHHYYEIILAKKGNQQLSDKELYFGPILYKKQTEVFKKKWQWQKEIHERILEGLTFENEKYPCVKQEYDWICEVLNEN